jgi:hypothetical protein
MKVAALASRKSIGTECSFGDKTVKTKDLDTFDFTGWDIALFAIGSEATAKIRAQGREGRLRGDRQLVALPLRPRRSADRAGGEPEASRATRRRTSSPTPTAPPRRWWWR